MRSPDWSGSMEPKSPAAVSIFRCRGGGRCHQSKIIVVGAVEVKDGGLGRIRLAEVPNYSAGSLPPYRTKIAGGPQSCRAAALASATCLTGGAA